MSRWISAFLAFSFIACWGTGGVLAQDQPQPPPKEENFKPTWETQRLARTYLLGVPAPRGQICDRNGEPLAQTRLCYNLGINFPTPLDLSNKAAVAFARQQIALAERLTGRHVTLSDEAILRHYLNRGMLPLDIAQNLTEKEQEAVTKEGAEGLALHPVYLRSYPNGTLAAHILGHVGRTSRPASGPLENNELLWPETEGREGLELTFNGQLTGKPGQSTLTFDAKGRKVSDKITIAPEPGNNVITTLDLNLQRMCEKALAEGCKRGAIVIIDPASGDILAMASYPTFDPNQFIPEISPEQYKALNSNPDKPLLARAFRSMYPPGSTFKVFVGIAALESGTITPEEEFPGPPAFQIGNKLMHNWKKTDAGMLNIAGALEQSCNTWFFQVGIKTGAQPIIDWAHRFGFSAKTEIPLRAEAEGLIPTDEYSQRVEKRKLLDGDVANFAIGQGATLVTPLQLAQAMATLGNGGTLYRTRLVQQVQGLDGKITTGYEPRIRTQTELRPETLATIKKGMIDVVTGGHGTAGRAAVEGIEVAGKTGTAQWGPSKEERNAAWFAGFAPADNPKYAFAAIYESDPHEGKASHGGTVAAPMIGKVLKQIYKVDDKPKARKKAKIEVRKALPVTEPEAGEQTGD